MVWVTMMEGDITAGDKRHDYLKSGNHGKGG